MEDMIMIKKSVLFGLASSHSNMAQAEYNRNPGYNSDHYSHKAEDALIVEIHRLDLFDEFIAYISSTAQK